MWQEMADADAEYQRQEAENVSPFEHHRDEGRFDSGGGNNFNYIYSPSNLGGPLVDESAGAAGGSGLASGSGRRRKKSGRDYDDAITCSSQSSGNSVQLVDGRDVRQFYLSNPRQTYLNRMDAERREQIVTRSVSDETAQRWMRQEEDQYRKERIKEEKERRERLEARARAETWFQRKGWKDWQYKRH
jgi:hypothetical protein